MKIKILRIVKVICFCVLVLAMVNHLTQLFTPKWLENRWASAKTNKTFYDIEKNTIDVGFYGSSVVAAAIDPYQLYKEEGISAYNFGVMSQAMSGTYFWFNESLKTQTPKVVCVEVKAVGRKSDKELDKARKSYDYMQWGVNKLKYAIENKNTYPDSSFAEYLFPLSKYHDRWSELSYDDYDFMSGNYKSYTRGMATLTTYCKDTDPSYADTKGIVIDKSKKGSDYNKTNSAYIKRIIEECQQKGIHVVLFKTPDPTWSTTQHNHVVDVIKKYDNVDFYDLSTREWFEENDFDYAIDGCDYFHINMLGAKKVTAYLGKQIKKTIELPDRREDSKVSKLFDEELKLYECAHEDALLCFETDVTKYLEAMNKNRYTILISSGKDLSSAFTEKQKKALLELGMNEKFFKKTKTGQNTIAVLDKDSKNAWFQCEKIIDKTSMLNRQAEVKTGVTYKIVSGKKNSSIVFAESDYTVNSTALNIVVYDKTTNAVADSVALSLDTKGALVLHR